MHQASFICCILNRVGNKCLKLWWVYKKGTWISITVIGWGGEGVSSVFLLCYIYCYNILNSMKRQDSGGEGAVGQGYSIGEGENYRRETQAAQCLPSHTTIHLHFRLLYILLIFTCLPHYLVIS